VQFSFSTKLVHMVKFPNHTVVLHPNIARFSFLGPGTGKDPAEEASPSDTSDHMPLTTESLASLSKTKADR